MKRKHIGITAPAIAMLVLVFAGCILGGGDGGDGKTDSVPKVTSVSVKKGSVQQSADIDLTWTGNDRAEEYQIVLDGDESAWIDTTSTALTGLDEGLHVLIVRARQDTLIGSDTTVQFEVDAIQGPGVLFSPRKVSGISLVTVYLEDVQSLMSAHIEIATDEDTTQLTNFEPNKTYAGDGSLLILTDAIDRGHIVLDIAFTGALNGAEGRVELGTFLVRGVTEGFVVADSLSTQFRNTDNEPIEILGLDRIRIGQ